MDVYTNLSSSYSGGLDRLQPNSELRNESNPFVSYLNSLQRSGGEMKMRLPNHRYAISSFPPSM